MCAFESQQHCVPAQVRGWGFKRITARALACADGLGAADDFRSCIDPKEGRGLWLFALVASLMVLLGVGVSLRPPGAGAWNEGPWRR